MADNIILTLKEACKKRCCVSNFDYENKDIQLFGEQRSIIITFVRSKNKSIDQYNVAWVLDDQSSNCMRCNVIFTLLNRKHHCRLCGYLICNTCSPNVKIIPELQEMRGSRVCKICFELKATDLNKEENAVFNKVTVNTAPDIVMPAKNSQDPVNNTSTENIAGDTLISHHINGDCHNTEKTTSSVTIEKAMSTPVPHSTPLITAKSVAMVTPDEVSNEFDNSSIIVQVTRNQNQFDGHRKGSEQHSFASDNKRNSQLNQRPAPRQVENNSAAGSLSQKEQAERLLANEEKERKDSLLRSKEEKLKSFLSIDDIASSSEFQNLSVAERAELTKLAMDTKRSELDIEKRRKLESFLKLNTESEERPLTLSERKALVLFKAEEERRQKLDAEKKLKLQAFLQTEVNPANSNGERGHGQSKQGSIASRFEEAKKKQQDQERERMNKLKADPGRLVLSKKGTEIAPTEAEADTSNSNGEDSSAALDQDSSTTLIPPATLCEENKQLCSESEPPSDEKEQVEEVSTVNIDVVDPDNSAEVESSTKEQPLEMEIFTSPPINEQSNFNNEVDLTPTDLSKFGSPSSRHVRVAIAQANAVWEASSYEDSESQTPSSFQLDTPMSEGSNYTSSNQNHSTLQPIEEDSPAISLNSTFQHNVDN